MLSAVLSLKVESILVLELHDSADGARIFCIAKAKRYLAAPRHLGRSQDIFNRLEHGVCVRSIHKAKTIFTVDGNFIAIDFSSFASLKRRLKFVLERKKRI